MKLTLAFLVLILATCVAAFAPALGQNSADSSALDAILKKMDTAAAGFRTTRAEFEWDRYEKVIDEVDDIQSGTIYYRRTGKDVEMKLDITKPDLKYVLFSDGKFHNIGVGVSAEGDLTDLGRYSETKVEADKGAFKTPSLRNATLSAPYMHDGSLKTLKEVVDFYAGGGNSNPYLDPNIKAIHLSGKERADLVEFLSSLTGDAPLNAGPP